MTLTTLGSAFGSCETPGYQETTMQLIAEKCCYLQTRNESQDATGASWAALYQS